jgi:site-specific recombinase XerD
MFELLFKRPHALTRHLKGPMVKERLLFLNHLAGQGISLHSLHSIASYLLACMRYLRLADRPGETITYTEVATKADRWANRRPRPPKMKRRRLSRAQFLRYATSWLRFLGQLRVPTVPQNRFDDRIDAFADFLRTDKGLVLSTIQAHCSVIRQFLDHIGPNNGSIRNITLKQIDQAFMELIAKGNYARTTIKLLAYYLRSFFRYAEAKGWCQPGLVDGIRGPRVFALESLPTSPSWQNVQQLLATTEGDKPGAIRDRAILMLLAVYGLRACEVRSLRLDDFDWRQERLCITRGKTRSVQIYPLSRSIGDAVLRYLKVRRRSNLREVFLTRLPPFRPLGTDAVGQMVRRRWKALDVTLQHYGSHSLRHACATHLLERGLSLKEIGDHLGHRHYDSTRIYAKVDLTSLRQVADFEVGDLL